jgi:hypothetical protein
MYIARREAEKRMAFSVVGGKEGGLRYGARVNWSAIYFDAFVMETLASLANIFGNAGVLASWKLKDRLSENKIKVLS